MKLISAIVFGISTLALPTIAEAQIASLLVGKKSPDGVSAKYRKNNVIRAEAIVSRILQPSEAFRKAMTKIAQMAQDKGYSRIGMTKQTCGTLMMSGIPVHHKCRILAQMVQNNEEATPEGDAVVYYYRVSSILAGRIAPENNGVGLSADPSQ